jgi:hypothetical protein
MPVGQEWLWLALLPVHLLNFWVWLRLWIGPNWWEVCRSWIQVLLGMDHHHHAAENSIRCWVWYHVLSCMYLHQYPRHLIVKVLCYAEWHAEVSFQNHVPRKHGSHEYTARIQHAHTKRAMLVQRIRMIIILWQYTWRKALRHVDLTPKTALLS